MLRFAEETCDFFGLRLFRGLYYKCLGLCEDDGIRAAKGDMNMLKEADPEQLTQAYPMAWSMSYQEQSEEVSVSVSMEESHHMLRFDQPGSVFDEWLKEFRDDRAGGGSSPPPLT